MLEALLPAAAIPAAGWAAHATLLYRQLHTERRDPVSGLIDRRTWDRRAEQLLRRGKATALAFIDLDDFKPVNDTFGHRAGDAVLRAIGARLADHLDGWGIATRSGGDEFPVIARVGDNESELAAFAAGLHDLIGQPVPWPGGPLTVSASIGICRIGDLEHPTLSAATDAADLAMLAAKDGRGRRGRTAAPVGDRQEAGAPE
ncbi:GGDEF domain-containing protein [Streptomyces violaceusniger]|uniref:GGDEF domain-containing protein n=1 Tax=Streptomyces violaceusniger TaxID=68280 RepID=UPI0034472F70